MLKYQLSVADCNSSVLHRLLFKSSESGLVQKSPEAAAEFWTQGCFGFSRFCALSQFILRILLIGNSSIT